MFKINNIPITPTLFPDNTSQIWKLPEELFLMQTINVEWYFHNEGEVVQLQQIVDLFRSSGPRIINLYIDYLPYARQDKKISNTSTFALHSFGKILDNMGFDKISILDPHSDIIRTVMAKTELQYVDVENFIDATKKSCNAEIICFPDFGASDRYNKYYNEYITLKKTRNLDTGEITGLGFHMKTNIKDKVVLIVDDICDRGGTFIAASKLLYDNEAKEVNLYITHGIFSGGLKIIKDSGIKRIFTKNGEVMEVQNNIVYKELK